MAPSTFEVTIVYCNFISICQILSGVDIKGSYFLQQNFVRHVKIAFPLGLT